MFIKIAGRKKKSKIPTYTSKIQRAGNANKVLNITYTDKKGKVSNRFVEPYKLIGDDFWAYSIDKDQIRRFKIPQIGNVKITNKKYQPRWPIEIEGVKSMNKVAMYKVAMYKEEIYKQAAVIKSRMTVDKNGRKIDSRIAIHKPWYRSDKPDKYKSIVMEDIYSITPEQIKKWESSDTTREEKIKILEDVQSRLNKRTSLRAVKPLIFGRKRFDYMAKNPVHYNLYLDPSYDQNEFADAALRGFSRNRKPSEIYDYYKSKNWEGKIFSK